MNSSQIISPPSGTAKPRRILYSRVPSPAALVLIPADETDFSSVSRLCDALSEHALDCAAFEVNWTNELAPWDAEAVFKAQAPFKGGAHNTLKYIDEMLLPSLERSETLPLIIGGYSLAGLFALWCGFNSLTFDGVAAASPSVWYPGFIEYIHSVPFHAHCAALSLGDTEAAVRHPLLRTVDDHIKQTRALLSKQNVRVRLDYNPGNHFVDADQRLVSCIITAAELLRA